MSLSASPEKLIAAYKAAVDTAFSFLNTSLNGFEKLSSLSLSATRNTITDHFEHAHNLIAAKDLHAALSLQSARTKPQIEQLATYSRSVYDIASEIQEDLTKLLESKHAELNNAITSALDWYAKSTANSEAAVAAVKSAISAANTAFANANKAVRQVADITDASINATSSATARSVATATGAAPTRSKKAA